MRSRSCQCRASDGFEGRSCLSSSETSKDNPKPFLQLDVRVLEYGARDDAESIAVLRANHHLAGTLVHGLRAALANIMEGRVFRVNALPPQRGHLMTPSGQRLP